MADEKKEEGPPQSRLHRFITTYSTFFSSFVIGSAGLIATAIYQSKQQAIAQKQADAQIEISRLNTDNQWKIERAEILSKNLQVLAANTDSTVDQRYGVLLSLTRGDIIDPELAVSYALELGEHNPDYMRSVLLNVPRKSYLQLAHNYVPTCQERYGVTRLAPACKADKGAARSQSISELVADELQTGNAAPLGLLADEQQVRSQLPRLTGLFEPYLDALYEKRQNQELEKFEASSTGARLVAALLLAADRSGEQVQSEERGERDRFRAVRRAWLEGYLLGRSCDPDCKGRIADLLVTNSGGAGGAFDHALSQLLERPEPELTSTIGRLHARLLWCQVDPAVVEELRDKVIVPAIVAGFKAKPAGDERLDDLIGLMALVPEPRAGTPERAAWDGMLEAARKQPERLQRCFYSRRSTAERQRKNPSQALKAGDFCIAGGVADTAPAEE